MRVTLQYEKLALRVKAAKSHLEVVSPPTIAGRSGVTHRFDFVAVGGKKRLAFDICEMVSETDVIKTFAKQLDTGASAFIILAGERMTEGAARLAAEYGLRVLRPPDFGSAFRTREISASATSPLTKQR